MGYFTPRILVHEIVDKFLNFESQNRRMQRILDAAERFGAKFTFFITASNVTEDNAHFVQDIVDRGHEIGSHSYEHISFADISRDEARDQIGRSLDVLNRFADVRGFRAPYLKASPDVLDACRDLGLTYSSSNYGEGPTEHDGVLDIPVNTIMDCDVVQIEGITDTREIQRRWAASSGSGKVLLFHPWRLGARKYAAIMPSILDSRLEFVTMSEFKSVPEGCALTFDLDFMQTRQLYVHSLLHLVRSPHLRKVKKT